MKKFLAAFLSLLMICTMASGVFAAGYIIPGASTIVTNPSDGTGTILSNNFMYNECPECGYDYAVYYVLDGSVKYYCSSCEKSGIIVAGGKSCVCGVDCRCSVECACGRKVSCGNMCNHCHKPVSCGSDCRECGVKLSCVCGSNCGCSVKCSSCSTMGKCGKYCSYCDLYLTCGRYCKDCSRWDWNWDWNWSYYDCVCGRNCDCSVKCSSCSTMGKCGKYCSDCGAYLTCGRYCKDCSKWGWSWDDYYYSYSVSVSTSAGGDYSITNGEFGKYGETKTITVEPDYGYVISDVVVNGRSIGAVDEFEISMVSNYYINIYFKKVNLAKKYIAEAEAVGNGRVTLVQNGKSVKDTSSVKAAYGDKLVYRFIPGGDNYYVADVKINGRSIGAQTMYTVSSVKANLSVQAVFGWNCPYSDIDKDHAAAVEYVTEAGIMSGINRYMNTDIFGGTNRVSTKTFASALAEMADTDDKLDTVDERIEWAVSNGLISKDADLTAIVDVKKACSIISKYIDVIEDDNDITFIGNKSSYTAKETCIALDLVSEKAYTNNKNISRYDLAEVCYAIANLDYKAN